MRLGVGRRLMRVRRMLIPMWGNFFYRSGRRVLVMGVMLFMTLVFIFGVRFIFIGRVMNDAPLKNETS